MAARKTRSKAQREARLVRVVELFSQGLTVRRMAKALGVSHTQVEYDLRTMRQRWQETNAAQFATSVCQEVARIDAAERAPGAAGASPSALRSASRSVVARASAFRPTSRLGTIPATLASSRRSSRASATAANSSASTRRSKAKGTALNVPSNCWSSSAS